MEPTTVSIPTAIIHATAKEHSRYAITGVEVRKAAEDGRGYASATNGKILAVVPVGLGGDTLAEPIILPPEVLSKRAAGEFVAVNDDARNQRTSKTAALMDGSFPPAADVLPIVTESDITSGEVRAISIDAGLLANLAKSISTNGHVTLFIRSAKNCIAVNGDSGFGAIMPDAPCSNSRSIESDIEAKRNAYATGRTEYAESRS